MSKKPRFPFDAKRFELEGPRDLLHKLVFEIDRMKTCDPAHPHLVAFGAFDCATTARSLNDWTLGMLTGVQRAQFGITSGDPMEACRQFRKYLVTRNMPEAEDCHLLASGLLHFVCIARPIPESSQQTNTKHGLLERAIGWEAVLTKRGIGQKSRYEGRATSRTNISRTCTKSGPPSSTQNK